MIHQTMITWFGHLVVLSQPMAKSPPMQTRNHIPAHLFCQILPAALPIPSIGPKMPILAPRTDIALMPRSTQKATLSGQKRDKILQKYRQNARPKPRRCAYSRLAKRLNLQKSPNQEIQILWLIPLLWPPPTSQTMPKWSMKNFFSTPLPKMGRQPTLRCGRFAPKLQHLRKQKPRRASQFVRNSRSNLPVLIFTNWNHPNPMSFFPTPSGPDRYRTTMLQRHFSRTAMQTATFQGHNTLRLGVLSLIQPFPPLRAHWNHLQPIPFFRDPLMPIRIRLKKKRQVTLKSCGPASDHP